MFNKSFVSILLILVISLGLILQPACRRAGPPPIEEQIGGFVGGMTGLDIHLMDGAPPAVIQGGSLTPFSFIVALENVGEADVGPGTDNPLVMIRLEGIMYNNFGLTDATAAKALDTRLASAKRNFDDTILPGEINYIAFENLIYEPRIYDSLALTIRATACYDYESYATTKFCMKRDVLESWEDASICTLSGFKPVANSGSPIHVTSFEERAVKTDTIQLNMVIEHVGTGLFFYRNDYQGDLFDVCVIDEIYPHIYKLEVFVEPIDPNAYEVECMRLDESLPGGGAYGTIRMPRGAPITMSCFLKRTSPMSTRIYEDLLNIRLRYRYGDFIETPILIQGRP